MVYILTALMSLVLFSSWFKLMIFIIDKHIGDMGWGFVLCLVYGILIFFILNWWVNFSTKHEKDINNFFNKIHNSFHGIRLHRKPVTRINDLEEISENPNIKDFYEAIENQNEEAAYAALEKNVSECPNKNSYCMTEVFCPDCPLVQGGLTVSSSRENWSIR